MGRDSSDLVRTCPDSASGIEGAVFEKLSDAAVDGLTNVQLGRSLGIYPGHVGHEGHVSRTILALMENDGLVEQNPENKRWIIRSHTATTDSQEV